MNDSKDRVSQINALIAKAERTDNQHEAETFFAKAHELMMRHAIDEEMLVRARGGRRSSEPVVVRWAYSTGGRNLPAKRRMLNMCGRHNNVRVIFYGATSQEAALIGFAEDAEFVKTLFASLMLQGTRFGKREYAAETFVASSSRVYLTQFLLGFCDTVDGRLAEMHRKVVEETSREATGGTSTELALIDRSKVVNDKLVATFPKLGSIGGRAKADYAARSAGRAAGRNADVSGGRGTVGGSRGALGKGR